MRRYGWLTVFGIAMAYLESAVVVYLRALYYPRGFDFPIALMPGNMAGIEVAREAATIVMLYVAGRLGAATGWQQFAGFMFLFGVWDIFYYVWLKVLLAWPASLGTWDILFLIPVPWLGPVWAPVVISLSLILAALAIEHTVERGRTIRVTVPERVALVVAGLLVVLSFTLNWKLVTTGGTPGRFPMAIFWAGEALGLAVLVRSYRRSRGAPLSARS
jgi:hypothetical protein